MAGGILAVVVRCDYSSDTPSGADAYPDAGGKGCGHVVRIEEVTVVRAPRERCFDLARSVEVHLAGNIHWGEAAVASAGITHGLVGLGERVGWQARHFGVWWTLTSEITAMDRPGFFQDVMTHGPFGFMKHDHIFESLSLSDDETEMTDVFCFAGPLGVLGWLAEILFLRRYMRGMLCERNAVLKRIAETSEWKNYLPPRSEE
jgi:ligand-binding SRPBCC domain-containing protein